MKTQSQFARDPYFQQFQAAYHTQFEIPEYLLASNKLSIYKRYVWSARFFLDQWNKNIGTYAAGTIHRFNEIFHVNFASTCSLGKIKEAISAGGNPQITISFRKSPKLPAICIVDFSALKYENPELDSALTELTQMCEEEYK